MATREPVRVTQPTIPERPMATQTAYSSIPASGTFPCSNLPSTSESATKADAPPPKPLKSATNSGIPVISTLVAIRAPIIAPMARPPTISSQPIIPSDCILTRVTTTARSIPIEPSLFPCGAVLGLDSLFIPMINSAAAIR